MEMAVASAWGVQPVAAAPPPRHEAPASMRESRLSMAGSVLRRPILRSERPPRTVSCRCSGGRGGTVEGGVSDWDWNRWRRHFSEIEVAEDQVSLLRFQLEDAIEKEEFFEAAKLKTAIAQVTSKDVVAKVMSELKNAIEEERYYDASRLASLAGSDMVGWWAGWSMESDDPFGKIVRITPAVGRYVAKSYSPRQLLNGSSGTLLFEIFLIKDDDGTYTTQVVYLQPAKRNSTLPPLPPKSPDIPSHGTENSSVEGIPTNENAMEKENDTISTKDSSEDGIKSVLNFLKERIPGFKVKVLNVSAPEEIKADAESLEELIQENTEQSVAAEDSIDETRIIDDIQHEDSDSEEADSTEGDIDATTKLFIGGVVPSKEDVLSKPYVRIPATLNRTEKDMFVLDIPGKVSDPDGEKKAAKIKVAAIFAETASDLTPSDVAKTFLNADDVPAKVAKEVREVIKLAVSQAQRRNKLSKTTSFNRIITATDSLDPFNGLYVGSFGPYGFEVVQLRRKYGHWNDTDDYGNGSEIEFFEYVEAVKLTGDLNVPAGQVTFRAKIGKGRCLPDRGYPLELGVVASYKGQGRIAEPGFKNPRWVDGELVLLNGKGFGPHMRGTELGFLYVVPEHSFLVLFDRLKLPQ